MLKKPGRWRVVFLTGDKAYDAFLDMSFEEAMKLAATLNGTDKWIPDEEWAEEHAAR